MFHVSCVIIFSLFLFSPASLGSHPQEVVPLLSDLNLELEKAKKLKVQQLRKIYISPKYNQEERLLATLALGSHYLETSPQSALPFFLMARSLAGNKSDLKELAEFHLIVAQFKLGAFESVIGAAHKQLGQNDFSGLESSLYHMLLTSYFHTGRYREFATFFDRVKRQFKVLKGDIELKRFAAESYSKIGRINEYHSMLENIAYEFPSSKTSVWAFNKLVTLSCGTEFPRYYFSQRLLQHLGRSAAVHEGIREFILASMDWPLRDTKGRVAKLSDFEKADFLFRSRFYEDVIELIDEQLESHENLTSKSIAELKYLKGRALIRSGENEPAAKAFYQAKKLHPDHGMSLKAKIWHADALRYSQKFDTAADLYQALGSVGNSRWYHFWSLQRSQKYAQALQLLNRNGYLSMRDSEERRAAKNYWRGRLHEQLGRRADALTAFKKVLQFGGDGYYSNLVLARYPELSFAKKAALATDDWFNDRENGGIFSKEAVKFVSADPKQNESLALVGKLHSVGLTRIAKKVLEGETQGKLRHEVKIQEAARLGWDVGYYRASRHIYRSPFSVFRNLPKNWSKIFEHQTRNRQEWMLFYPPAYSDLLSNVENKIGIDRYLVMSVIRAESFYNRQAVSPVGARGLMQIMPYTGIRIADLISDESFRVQNLSEETANIVYGSFYLKKLMRYYKENYVLALAAYNAGPQAVNRWLKRCQSCELDEFIEEIPYTETRRYVKKIMKYYSRYRRIYQQKLALYPLPQIPSQLGEGVVF